MKRAYASGDIDSRADCIRANARIVDEARDLEAKQRRAGLLRDEDEVTDLFLGFDGSLIVNGPARLRWHGLPLHVRQPLPKPLRRYPPNYRPWQRIAFGLWKRLYKVFS